MTLSTGSIAQKSSRTTSTRERESRISAYSRGVNGVVLLILVLGVLTGLWLKGFLNFGGVLSLYRRIRLAALLWAVVILAIGLLRIFGVGGDGF